MMLFFKSWCENIIIGVVVSMIIEMICPERFLKYIKIVVGIYILYLIIAPIIDKVNLETINGFVDDMDVYVSSDSLIEETLDEWFNRVKNDVLNTEKDMYIQVYDFIACQLDCT